jgi:asparagine synthase (glutamine-hydrolysing)
LVAIGGYRDAPWDRMLEDVEIFGGDGVATWNDPAEDLALGRAYRHERGSAVEPALVRDRQCTVVLDGRLSQARADSSGELGDSHAIIESYLRWGDECSAHLEGEFAFALWDERRRRLVCGCDVLGRRTLAFHHDGALFLACTRAVALLRHPRVPRELDATYLTHSLCELASHTPGTTAFQSIRRLRPGFCLTVQGRDLDERRVDELRLAPAPRHGRAKDAYDAFWSLLDESTRTRLRGVSSPCVLLSGGLDSACVTSSMCRHVREPHAFSIVRDSRAFLDERNAVEAVLRRYPSVRWHPVEATSDLALVESDSEGPVCDDPVVGAAALLPSRLRAWRMMASEGFQLALDGEGGDEIFDLSTHPFDVVRTGGWSAAAGYLLRHPARRSMMWRELVVPRLPESVRRQWLAREQSRTQAIPPWMTAAFSQREATRRALAQQDAWLTRSSLETTLPAMLENVIPLATRQAERLRASRLRVDLASPFWTRTIVEFAGRVPAALRLHAAHRKVFLRRASEGRIPDEVRWRPKREGLYAALLQEALAGDRAQSSLRSAMNLAGMCEWIDFGAVQGLLARERDLQAGPLAAELRQRQLHALVAFVGWRAHVESVYGPLPPSA